MTSLERISSILSGGTPDRPPFAAWGHVMNFCDRNVEDFARATIEFQNANGFDFVKIMSNPYYMLEDMGIDLRVPLRYDECLRRTDRLLVPRPEDWGQIPFAKVGAGALAREREAICRVVDYFQGSVPVIATIFTPAMWVAYSVLQATDMAHEATGGGGYTGLLSRYLMDNERQVRPALERFAGLNRSYMEDLLSVGVSGFFYCTEHARGSWTRDAFESFEEQYDLQALEVVHGRGLFNILHVCGEGKLRLDWVLHYPVEALNWEDRSAMNPSLSEIRSLTDKILVGGMDRRRDLLGTSRQEIKSRLVEKVRSAMEQAGSKLIVSGGCDWGIDTTYRFYIWREVMEELKHAE